MTAVSFMCRVISYADGRYTLEGNKTNRYKFPCEGERIILTASSAVPLPVGEFLFVYKASQEADSSLLVSEFTICRPVGFGSSIPESIQILISDTKAPPATIMAELYATYTVNDIPVSSESPTDRA